MEPRQAVAAPPNLDGLWRVNCRLGARWCVLQEPRPTDMTALIDGPDGKPRCHWSAATPGYLHYHDREWGFPVDDDFRLFEKLSLEGFQSGLSWRTILEKRENF